MDWLNDDDQIVKKFSQRRQHVIKDVPSKTKSKIILQPVKQFNVPEPDVDENEQDTVDDHPVEANNENASHVSISTPQPKGPSLQELKAKVDQKISVYKNDERQRIDQEIQDYRQQEEQKAHSEIEQEVADTKQRAFQEGKQKGEALFTAKSDELLTAINQLAASKKVYADKQHDFLMSLATTIAEKIVGHSLETDSQLFDKFFTEAFEKITDKDEVIIEVNPADIALVESFKKRYAEKFKDINSCDIKGNDTLLRGGCAIETKLGYVDARLESKLELLHQALQDSFIKRKGGLPSVKTDDNSEIKDTSIQSTRNNESIQESTEKSITEPIIESAPSGISDIDNTYSINSPELNDDVSQVTVTTVPQVAVAGDDDDNEDDFDMEDLEGFFDDNI